MDKLNVLCVTPELRGMVAIGGLAEVVIALSYALRRAGHDVRIAMPYYRYLDLENKAPKGLSPIWEDELRLGSLPSASVFQTRVRFKNDEIPVYLVRGHEWFDEATTLDSIYCSDPKPYFFLPAAILRFFDRPGDWLPDVIHCHDYHTGLLSVYLHTIWGGAIAGQKVRTVFTIHNMAFQGRGSADLLTYGGLPPSLGNFARGLSGMESHGGINCMKGAICYSDVTSTVSEAYATEICTPEQGKGLDGVLSEARRQGKLKGIVNGIDNEIWNPAKLDGNLAFSGTDPSGKARAKSKLREMCGLAECEDPIVSVRSRWSYQKGLELLSYALRTHRIHERAQVVVVAWDKTQDDPEYLGLWYELVGWASSFPKRIAFKYQDAPKTDLHYAGSDMFLMPSLFEPCGLGQMEAMRYGTIPIVRRTGGLADTVRDDWGFMFDWSFHEPLDQTQKREGAQKMMWVIEKALEQYSNRESWEKLVANAMTQNNDWSTRVRPYESLYQQSDKSGPARD